MTNLRSNDRRKKLTRSAAMILTMITVLTALTGKAAAKTVKYEYEMALKTPLTFTVEPKDYTLIPNGDGSTSIDFSQTMKAEIQKKVSEISQVAFDALISDHPSETMWMDPPQTQYTISVKLNASQLTGEFTVEATIDKIINVLIQNSGYTDPKGMYDFLVSEAKKFKPEGTTVYEKVKSIHDYICKLNKYDKNSPHPHSAYGALIDHRSVCEGYAEAFKLFCDVNGIPCIIVSGKTTEAHMWNYVKMDDGKWYALDATWDDDDKTGKPKTTYFLVGSKNAKYSKDHHANGDISGTKLKTFEYPTLSESDYTVKSGTVSSGDVSKFYYDQLNDEQKNIYDQLMKIPLPKGKTPVVTTTAKIETAPVTTTASTTSAATTSKPSGTTAAVPSTDAPSDTVPDTEPTVVTVTDTDPDPDVHGTDTEPGTQEADGSSTTVIFIDTADTDADTDGNTDINTDENTDDATSVISDASSDPAESSSADTGDDVSGMNTPLVIGIAAGIAVLIAALIFIVLKFSKSEKKQ